MKIKNALKGGEKKTKIPAIANGSIEKAKSVTPTKSPGNVVSAKKKKKLIAAMNKSASPSKKSLKKHALAAKENAVKEEASSLTVQQKKSLELRSLPQMPGKRKNKKKSLEGKVKNLNLKNLTLDKVLEKRRKKRMKKKAAKKEKSAEAEQVEPKPEVDGAVVKAEKAKRVEEKILRRHEAFQKHAIQSILKSNSAPSAERLRKNIVKAVAGVLASAKVADGGNLDLFSDVDDMKVFLRMGFFKNPGIKRTITFLLPHPHHLRNKAVRPAEVCLFVKDLPDHRNDPEKTAEHYKDIFSELGIDDITQIMTTGEVKREMNHFKVKANLARKYDAYLADNDVKPFITNVLGKNLRSSGRMVMPVNMKAKNLKEELSKALSRCCIPLKAFSDQSSAYVGRGFQTEDHIVENVLKAVDVLKQSLPGGWANVRQLNLQSDLMTLAVPIYQALSSGNEVEIDQEEYKEDTKTPIVDRLSTKPGVTISVAASGIVEVRGIKEEQQKEIKLSSPKTSIPTLANDARAKVADSPSPEPNEDDIELDEEELRLPGKLVKLEHAYLKQKLASSCENVDRENDDDNDDPANTSSSLDGIRKRQKRKRKVNLGEAPADGIEESETSESPRPPKSPTPDYSISNVGTPQVVTPSRKNKKQLVKSEFSGKVSPKLTPASSNNTPKLIHEGPGQDLGNSGKKKKKNSPLKTPLITCSTSNASGKKSNEKLVAEKDSAIKDKPVKPQKTRPRSILKPKSPVPARPTPTKGLGEAAKGRRVRFSLPNDAQKKKNRRKTMF
ncbi:unnamed protein product [Notodromas monacha]|uniref:Ribosomal L1 domain-containing protein 1 n=1 Tax=Notodromas monacha TaxID=399045 RepID=A0A7R9BIU8_9CRUS|nr:unnamed protein product [Notodromas monacha]CAG0916327.1 unnamed protein product [Notodromas monacha]